MKPPHFWSAGLDPQSRESAPVTRALLTPLAMLYAGLSARRIARANPITVSIPVICIGNLTSGGSGKTPIVKAMRDLLTAQGRKTASLSRGYGGKLKGPIKVDPTKHTARETGDEPLMLAQTGNAWISRNRVAGARAMIDAGFDAILMDDGHQNPSLHKDISILVIDTTAPFGNGCVIPKGPLREPIETGIKRADAVIMMGPKWVPPIVQDLGLPVFHASLERTAPIPDGPLFAFAGIGRPKRFFDALENDGGQICDSLSFADHHTYSRSDLKRLHKLAAHNNARLVTTEKDFARLDLNQRENITPIKVRAVIEDHTALLALLHPLFEEAPL